MFEATQPISFFHARAPFALKRDRFYRIYTKPHELLVVYAGPVPLDPEAVGLGVGVHTGAAGGLLAWLISLSVQKQTRKRAQQLDQANWQDLLRLAEQDKRSFRLEAGDVLDASIEPRSVWRRFAYLGPDHVGLLRIRHQQGVMTLQLLTESDMRLALEKLPDSLGDKLRVNVVWNAVRQRFVKRG